MSSIDRYFSKVAKPSRYGEPAYEANELNVFAVARDAIILVVLLILALGSFSVISPSERAVKITLGTASDEVYKNGLQFKWPVVSNFKVYDLAPHTTDLVIEVGPQGAITSDNQTVGIGAKVVWSYDGDQIKTLVTKYPDEDRLATIVNNTVLEALKAEIGKHHIYDLAGIAGKVASETRAAAAEKLKVYPVTLSQFNLTNWDWSDDFDAQIKATMNAQQKVATSKAEADRTEQEQRKQTIVAEASAKSNIAAAEGEKVAAELRASAKRAEGQGISDYNKLVAQNLDTELQFRKLEIEKIKAEKWNGAYVSEYVPLTAAGAVISIPAGGAK